MDSFPEQFRTILNSILRFLRKNRYFLLTILFLMLFCLLPLSEMATTKGHDIGFHLQRIDAYADELVEGNLFPRIYTTMLNDNGYATPLFYGQLLMIIPAGMVAWFDVTVVDAYAYFVAIIFSATVLSAFFTTLSITKKQKAAFCVAMMFGISSYLGTDLLWRCALGEAQAFIFLPIVFAGFYHITFGDTGKWWLLPAGLSGMIFCHTLSGLMTVFALVLFALFCIDIFIKQPKKLIYIGLSAVIFFLLSADFLFPMLEQMDSTTFLATDGFSATKYGTLAERTMPSWTIFYDSNRSLYGSGGIYEYFIPNGIGLAPLVFIILYVCLRRRVTDEQNIIWRLIVVSTILLYMTTEYFPWDRFQDIAGIIQFPWRFIIFPTYLFALATAIFFVNLMGKRDTNRQFVFMIVAVSLCSYVATLAPIFNQYFLYQQNEKIVEYNYVNSIGAGEYLPSCEEFDKHGSSANAYYKQAITGNSNKLFNAERQMLSTMTREHGVLTVEFFNASGNDAFIDVPLLMYKGYTAVLNGEKELDCEYGKYNRVRVWLEDATEGTIEISYTGTTIQKVSRAVSILTLILLILHIIGKALNNMLSGSVDNKKSGKIKKNKRVLKA